MAKNTPKGESAAARVISPQPLCIEFVLDETGSMASCSGQTVGGFNDYLTEQKTVPGECLFTLTKFEGGNLVTPYQDLSIEMVPQMTDRTFTPKGMTNLYDAIGQRIQAVQKRTANWAQKPKVLVVVMTDGGDNLSRTHTAPSIRDLITGLEETSDWTFVYLGANQNAAIVGKAMGFLEGNIRSFETAQMRETIRDLSACTTVYRTAGATKNFF